MHKFENLSLGDALFSKTQQKIFALLFTKPDQSYFTNEIIRWAGLGKGTVMRELERMLAAGLLLRNQRGNQHHYQANPHCPVYAELVAIARKTFGIGDLIKNALVLLEPELSQGFIYGSIAKGESSATSDVDLMLVGENLSYGQIMELLAPVEEMIGRRINPTIYTPADFLARLNAGNHFLTRVMDQARISLWNEGHHKSQNHKEEGNE